MGINPYFFSYCVKGHVRMCEIVVEIFRGFFFKSEIPETFIKDPLLNF